MIRPPALGKSGLPNKTPTREFAVPRTLDMPWFLDEYRKHELGIREKDSKYFWWIPLDRPILTACKNCPSHSDYCEVYAKVALVNRMYSAQLGRGRVGKYEAEDKVAQALC